MACRALLRKGARLSRVRDVLRTFNMQPVRRIRNVFQFMPCFLYVLLLHHCDQWLADDQVSRQSSSPIWSSTSFCTRNSVYKEVDGEITKHRSLPVLRSCSCFWCKTSGFEHRLASRHQLSIYMCAQLVCWIFSLSCHITGVVCKFGTPWVFFSKTCCSLVPVTKYIINFTCSNVRKHCRYSALLM